MSVVVVDKKEMKFAPLERETKRFVLSPQMALYSSPKCAPMRLKYANILVERFFRLLTNVISDGTKIKKRRGGTVEEAESRTVAKTASLLGQYSERAPFYRGVVNYRNA